MSMQAHPEARTVTRAALLGRDYHGVGFEILCQQGDAVEAGAVLMRDQRRPQIVFTAPAAGRVMKIERGARRRLVSLQIELDAALGSVRHSPPSLQDAESVRAFMQQTGAWSALRTRPFGNIPDPAAEPAALLVTALDAQPLAPAAEPIIEQYADEFRAAINALDAITGAPLHLCHAPGFAPPVDDRLAGRCVAFDGGPAAGLPGVHIHALCPIGFGGGEAWHIGYQETIALGHLLLTGSPWLERVITLGGSAVRNPRSLRAVPGAAIDELVAGELTGPETILLSGSALYGRQIPLQERFLGFDQRQITAERAHDGSADASARGHGVLLPSDVLDALAPPGIYPVPLLRALQVGDSERARELGALELVEEDLLPLSRACLSQADYAALLRATLDELEGAAR